MKYSQLMIKPQRIKTTKLNLSVEALSSVGQKLIKGNEKIKTGDITLKFFDINPWKSSHLWEISYSICQ